MSARTPAELGECDKSADLADPRVCNDAFNACKAGFGPLATSPLCIMPTRATGLSTVVHSLRECLFGEFAVGSAVVLVGEPPKTTRRSELSTVGS